MDKAEEYRKIAWDLISFTENIFCDDVLCDCDYESNEGCHEEDCYYILAEKDIQMFEEKLRKVQYTV